MAVLAGPLKDGIVRVEIVCDGNIIGHCTLTPEDPPMGVAGGRLEPSQEYVPETHAGQIGEARNERGAKASLSARSSDLGKIDCAGVFIEDFSEALGEIHVAVLGIPYPDYENFFGNHPGSR